MKIIDIDIGIDKKTNRIIDIESIGKYWYWAALLSLQIVLHVLYWAPQSVLWQFCTLTPLCRDEKFGGVNKNFTICHKFTESFLMFLHMEYNRTCVCSMCLIEGGILLLCCSSTSSKASIFYKSHPVPSPLTTYTITPYIMYAIYEGF